MISNSLLLIKTINTGILNTHFHIDNIGRFDENAAKMSDSNYSSTGGTVL